MQSRTESSKTSGACAACRARKVKCDSETPCQNCLRHGRSCVYPVSQRGKRTRPGRDNDSSPKKRSHQGFRIVPYQRAGQPTQKVAGPTRASRLTGSRSTRPEAYQASPARDEQDFPTISESAAESDLTAVVNATTTLGGTVDSPVDLQYPLPDSSLPPRTVRSAVAPDSRDSPFDRPDFEEGVMSSEKAYWEHHGPWSWVSVCSEPGIQWVCEKTGTDSFIDMANALTKAWSRRLRLKPDQARPRSSGELNETTAWKYATAYFEKCYDAPFGVIHRATFEHRLREHFGNANETTHQVEDAAWFALRNMVYAAGCRSALAEDESVSFVEAQEEAFGYFQNALSVFTELAFAYTGLTAVRALTVMAFYAEGLGCPALEYPLCAIAAQAALTKGLHREPAGSCGLSRGEILTRNWLWWTIYCLEKQLAFRSGRPSLIDDNHISTKVPTTAPPNSTVDVETMSYLVQHAKISAQVSNCIMTMKAFKAPIHEIVTTVQNIHDQLSALLDRLPPRLRVHCSEKRRFALALQDVGACYLHCAIYGSLMATHMIFFYPWMLARFGKNFESRFPDQIATSAACIAHSARQIIFVLRCVKTNVSSPSWIAFYYPIFAQINLFVHTLIYPHAPSAQSDLALLDVCAGHFGHMECITSGTIAFHFPRESAALAARMVKKAAEHPRRANREGDNPAATTTGALDSGDVDVRPEAYDPMEGDTFLPTTSPIHGEGSDYQPMDFDLEAWSIFAGYDIGTSWDDFTI